MNQSQNRNRQNHQRKSRRDVREVRATNPGNDHHDDHGVPVMIPKRGLQEDHGVRVMNHLTVAVENEDPHAVRVTSDHRNPDEDLEAEVSSLPITEEVRRNLQESLQDP